MEKQVVEVQQSLEAQDSFERKRMTPMKAIRKKCLDCSGTSHEVKLCTVTTCPLYDFRFGKNPFRPKREYTEEELERIRQRLAAARTKQGGMNLDDFDDAFEDELDEINEAGID